MSKFKKKSNTSQEIPTSALPDVIFMLLFFFMVTTVLRDTSLLVEITVPKATQIKKLEKKNLVSYVYIGRPKEPEKFGSDPRLQINDVFRNPDDIPRFVEQEKSKLDESEKDQLTISMKVDSEETKMGIVVDVQEKLREVNARKILYNATMPPPGTR